MAMVGITPISLDTTAENTKTIYVNADSIEDVVNHPKHYLTKSGIEAIDVIRAFTDGLDGMEAYCTGNILKYVCRWKNKNGIEDLEKASWYINYLIDILKKKENEK